MHRSRRFVAALLVLFLITPASAEIIEVKELNSKGLTAAIQQANAGDTVQLPGGTLELDAPIRPKSGIKLLGRGQEKTTLIYKGTTPGTFVGLSDCTDVEVAQMTLDGQNNPLVHQGITGDNSKRLWLHHLTISNLKAKTWGPHAILFSGHNPTMERGVTDSRINDCTIKDIGLGAEYGGGIRLAWGSVRNQVINNAIQNTGRGGIFGDHSADLIIRKNKVSGSGGEGLGIEIWGGCPRSMIEDNEVDHWISVDAGDQSAVRRNVIGTSDGTVKFIGIEIIARDVVVTDNVINRGTHIGLSCSNTPAKNNVFWGYNTIRDCIGWGAQLQGDAGGVARHYFYRCTFSNTVRGDARALYPADSGHGFRTNGNCREIVFEDCLFSKNGGDGLQFGGDKVDAITILDSSITGNGQSAMTGPARYSAVQYSDCKVEGNSDNKLPTAKPFPGQAPLARFRLPASLQAGTELQFECISKPNKGEIAERLWDFGDGIPKTTAAPSHTYEQPGDYRVTLIVWDHAGRGSRSEQTIHVLPK